MGRLQAIEAALTEINEAVFQELCDSFLFSRRREYASFSRTGSQLGKQKTVRGTPDMFFLLHNNKYIFVEYSTNISSGIGKLEDDLRKCLDSTKTRVNNNNIAEIIFCVNFRLKIEETNSLTNIISKFDISLTIYTLDSLALELKLNHRDLVHQYLGLPLDTGQVVSIDRFVAEYNKVGNGIATPLDNTFLHRERELSRLMTLINLNDFVLLSGPAGVGKTKLALEAMKDYVVANPTYQAYCISYKHCTLLDDLNQYLPQKEDYILFVDDANRIDALGQIIGFYQSFQTGKLKIVMTVRDYALSEVASKIVKFGPSKLDVEKFSDEQIIDIVSAKPFEILNHKYHAEILRIAEGNPRIAIMTALLAKAKQDIYVLTDVSELFESYFATLSSDISDLAADINMKCLGLIAFFSVIPFRDRQATCSILDRFDLEYSEFIDSVDLLGQLELVEIQYGSVKISEQNLSTYFFYKVFVDLNLLSFDTLLREFFSKNQPRFRECVISANNTFGPKKVMERLQPHLKKYFNLLGSDNDARFRFLKIFWFYLKLEALEFAFSSIESLPVCSTNNYVVTYEHNAFSYKKDDLIELVGEIFRFHENLKDSIELGFEYVKRKPHHLPNLIHKIKEVLTFDQDDVYTGFLRQVTLFDVLIDGYNRNELIYVVSFYELSKTFLEFQFEHLRGGRNSSYSWYRYPIPNDEQIRLFRSRIWNVFLKNFKDYPSISLNLLRHYSNVRLDVCEKLMVFDRKFILSAISKNLNSKNFEHCLYVQDHIRSYRRRGLLNKRMRLLSKQFTNSLYDTFKVLTWNLRRNREDYEYSNYGNFERQKEADIRRSFVFQEVEEIFRFFENMMSVINADNADHGFTHSLDLVVDSNLTNNFELGICLLKRIVAENNEIGYVPDIAFSNHLKDESSASDLWNIIKDASFNRSADWRISFFNRIDEKLINEEYLSEYILMFLNVNTSFRVNSMSLKRFSKVKPNIFKAIFELVFQHNSQNDIKLLLWEDFFCDHFDELGDDTDLIKHAYLQQYKIQDHFDFSGKTLLKILKQDKWFLLTHMQAMFDDDRTVSSSDLIQLGYVWEIEDIEIVLREVFDMFSGKTDDFWISDHFLNSFFQNLNEKFNPRAKEFLLLYCRENVGSSSRMNIVVDIARGRQMVEEVLLTFLKFSHNVEIFSEVAWIERSMVRSGEVISGDVEAAAWTNILLVVESASLGIKALPIKKRINDEIDRCLRSAEWERQRRFFRSN